MPSTWSSLPPASTSFGTTMPSSEIEVYHPRVRHWWRFKIKWKPHTGKKLRSLLHSWNQRFSCTISPRLAVVATWRNLLKTSAAASSSMCVTLPSCTQWSIQGSNAVNRGSCGPAFCTNSAAAPSQRL